jgi:hypothetical protein
MFSEQRNPVPRLDEMNHGACGAPGSEQRAGGGELEVLVGIIDAVEIRVRLEKQEHSREEFAAGVIGDETLLLRE